MATAAIPRPRRKPIQPGKIIMRGLFWLLIVLILIYTIFPFYWAIVSSLKSGNELFETPVAYWPKRLTFDNYLAVFENPNFLYALRNSALVVVSTVTLALVLGSLAAYAAGRLQFRGKNFMLYLILAMTMFPAIAVLGSLYQLIIDPCSAFGGSCPSLSLYNRLPALILSYLTFTLPFTIWVLTNFFKSMPGELEEAALVDGATPMQTFYMVLLPLAAPGLVTTGLLAFIGAWNELLFALTFTQDYQDGARTAIVLVATFTGRTEFELPWGSIMAASVTLTIPLVFLVLVFQRRILAGLTAGAVKG
jgi:trehalose/maltose transport system permease protein